MSKFLTENLDFEVIYRPLELKFQAKIGLLRQKTMLKNFLNHSKTTLKKSRKRLFDLVKNDPSKQAKGANFLLKIKIFGVIHQPFELKIHPKVDLLRPKTVTKQFLKNSKITLKKSRKRFFSPTKWP